MPLVPYSMRIVADALASVASDVRRTGRVATVSHPDLIARPEEVREIFGLEGPLKIRDDSAATVNWHKAHSITREVVDTAWLFRALGYEMTAFDKVEGRGGEVIHDLNHDLFDSSAAIAAHYEKYDLVYDCISNQVFDVASCMRTIHLLCRPGGYVLHTVPMQLINQGFYNVSPTFYFDFYGANDYDICTYNAVEGVYADRGVVVVDPVRRCRGVPDDAMNVVLVRKRRTCNFGMTKPTMRKFLLHPKCQIPNAEDSPL